MEKDFFVTNVKFFYVYVSSDYSVVKRFTITKEYFEKNILILLSLGYGCQHNVLCSNEFSSVHKDYFYADSDKTCCFEMMYERVYLDFFILYKII